MRQRNSAAHKKTLDYGIWICTWIGDIILISNESIVKRLEPDTNLLVWISPIIVNYTEKVWKSYQGDGYYDDFDLILRFNMTLLLVSKNLIYKLILELISDCSSEMFELPVDNLGKSNFHFWEEAHKMTTLVDCK